MRLFDMPHELRVTEMSYPTRVVLGPGALARLPAQVETPGAVAVAALAAGKLRGAAFDRQALFALEPHYVRKSEAEVKFPHGLGPGASK